MKREKDIMKQASKMIENKVPINRATLDTLLHVVNNRLHDPDILQETTKILKFIIESDSSRTILPLDLYSRLIHPASSALLKNIIFDTMGGSLKDLIESRKFDISKRLSSSEEEYISYVTQAFVEQCRKLPDDDLKIFFTNRLIPNLFDISLGDANRNFLIDVAFLIISFFSITKLSSQELEKFIRDVIDNYSKRLEELRSQNYSNWHKLWIFLVRFCGKHFHASVDLANKLLKIAESAFRNPSCEQRLQGCDCWKELIDNTSLDMDRMCSSKQITLLITPLKAKFSKMEQVIVKRFNLFVYLMDKLNDKSVLCLNEFLEFCFGPVRKSIGSPSGKQGQGKLVPQIWLPSVKVLCAVIGIEIQGSTLSFQSPIIHKDNISEFSEVISNSIAESCILLHKMDLPDEENTQIWKLMWAKLFEIMASSNFDVQKVCFNHFKIALNSYLAECKNADLIIVLLEKCYEEHLKNVLIKHFLLAVISTGLDFLYSEHEEHDQSDVTKFKTNFESQVSKLTEEIFILTHILNYISTLTKKDDFATESPKANYVTEILINVGMRVAKFCKNYPEIGQLYIVLLVYFKPDSALSWQVWQELRVESKIEVMSKLGNKLKENPLLSNNISTLLCVVLCLESRHKKLSILTEVTQLLSHMFAIPKFSKDEVLKLGRCLETCLDSISFSRQDVVLNDDCVYNVCMCIENSVDVQKEYGVLSVFENFISKVDEEVKKVFSERLRPLLVRLQDSDDSVLARKALSLNKSLMSENSNDVYQTSSSPISRCAKIVGLSKKSPSSANKAKVDALKLFGRNVESSRPLKVKGSLLHSAMSPNSRSRKILCSTKIKNSSPLLSDEKSTDFVPINTEVKLDVTKLKEHQIQVMKRRREDIPATYEDLTQSQSQDIFASYQDRPKEEMGKKEDTTSNTLLNSPENHAKENEGEENSPSKKSSIRKLKEFKITENQLITPKEKDRHSTNSEKKVLEKDETVTKETTKISSSQENGAIGSGKKHRKREERQGGNKMSEENIALDNTNNTSLKVEIEKEENCFGITRHSSEELVKIQRLDCKHSENKIADIKKDCDKGDDQFRKEEKRTQEKKPTREETPTKNEDSKEMLQTCLRDTDEMVTDIQTEDKFSSFLETSTLYRNEEKGADSLKRSVNKKERELTNLKIDACFPRNVPVKRHRRARRPHSPSPPRKISRKSSPSKTLISPNRKRMGTPSTGKHKSRIESQDLKKMMKKEEKLVNISAVSLTDNTSMGTANFSSSEESPVTTIEGLLKLTDTKKYKGKMVFVRKLTSSNYVLEGKVSPRSLKRDSMVVLEASGSKNVEGIDGVQMKNISNINTSVLDDNKIPKSKISDEITGSQLGRSKRKSLPTKKAVYNENVLKKLKIRKSAPSSAMKFHVAKDANGELGTIIQKMGKSIRKKNIKKEDSKVVKVLSSSQSQEINERTFANLFSRKSMMDSNFASANKKRGRRSKNTIYPLPEAVVQDESEDVIESSQEPLESRTSSPATSSPKKQGKAFVKMSFLKEVYSISKKNDKQELLENKTKDSKSREEISELKTSPVKLKKVEDLEGNKEINIETNDGVCKYISKVDGNEKVKENKEKCLCVESEQEENKELKTDDTISQVSLQTETYDNTKETENKLSQADTETCDSSGPVITPQLQLDLPKPPTLTDSEQAISLMDTVSIHSQDLDDQVEPSEKASKPYETAMTAQETTLINDNIVSLDTVVDILTTPLKGSANKELVSSPISADTPTRTEELLNSTGDISPISSQDIDEPVVHLEITLPEEPENVTTPLSKFLSSTTSRSRRLFKMVNFAGSSPRIVKKDSKKDKKVDLKMNSVRNIKTEQEHQDELLTFKRVLPSQLATPQSGILKRKAPDSRDPISPFAKRKRVNFSDPCTTSEKRYQVQEEEYSAYEPPTHYFNLFDDADSDEDPVEEFISTIDEITEESDQPTAIENQVNITSEDEIEDLYDRKAKCTEQINDETQASMDVTNVSVLNCSEPIYEKLINCTDDVLSLCNKLASPMFSSLLKNKLKSKKIYTIGDLARLNEVEVNRLPFRKPAIKHVFRELDDYFHRHNCTQGKDQDDNQNTHEKLVADTMETNAFVDKIADIEANDTTINISDDNLLSSKVIEAVNNVDYEEVTSEKGIIQLQNTLTTSPCRAHENSDNAVEVLSVDILAHIDDNVNKAAKCQESLVTQKGDANSLSIAAIEVKNNDSLELVTENQENFISTSNGNEGIKDDEENVLSKSEDSYLVLEKLGEEATTSNPLDKLEEVLRRVKSSVESNVTENAKFQDMLSQYMDNAFVSHLVEKNVDCNFILNRISKLETDHEEILSIHKSVTDKMSIETKKEAILNWGSKSNKEELLLIQKSISEMMSPKTKKEIFSYWMNTIDSEEEIVNISKLITDKMNYETKKKFILGFLGAIM